MTMQNIYAIIENQLVVNNVYADTEFASQQGWVLNDVNADIGWKYIDGQFIPYAPVPDYSAQNKQQATALLQQTDWTCTVDINNPQYSNPYLMNQDAFLAYRSTVRNIAVNPPTTPVTFPTPPQAVWSS